MSRSSNQVKSANCDVHVGPFHFRTGKKTSPGLLCCVWWPQCEFFHKNIFSPRDWKGSGPCEWPCRCWWCHCHCHRRQSCPSQLTCSSPCFANCWVSVQVLLPSAFATFAFAVSMIRHWSIRCKGVKIFFYNNAFLFQHFPCFQIDVRRRLTHQSPGVE